MPKSATSKGAKSSHTLPHSEAGASTPSSLCESGALVSKARGVSRAVTCSFRLHPQPVDQYGAEMMNIVLVGTVVACCTCLGRSSVVQFDVVGDHLEVGADLALDAKLLPNRDHDNGPQSHDNPDVKARRKCFGVVCCENEMEEEQCQREIEDVRRSPDKVVQRGNAACQLRSCRPIGLTRL